MSAQLPHPLKILDAGLTLLLFAVALVLIAMFSGCASSQALLDRLDLEARLEDWARIGDHAGTPDAPAIPEGDEIDLAQVVWHGPDIRAWPITSDLPAVTVSGGQVRFAHSQAGKWPVKQSGSTDVEGNPWVIAQVDGRWHAASFEWLRPGQTSKPVKTVAGDHCKTAPLSGDWRPASGDTLYIGVSALARGSVRSVKARSAFREVVWP